MIIGQWSKRDCPGDNVLIPGELLNCFTCPTCFIDPHLPGLRIVELES